MIDTCKWGWMEIGSDEAFGPFESRAAAIVDAESQMRDGGAERRVEIRVGRCKVVDPTEYCHLDVAVLMDQMEEYACDEMTLEDAIFSVRVPEGDAQAALNGMLMMWCRMWVQCEHWTLVDTENVEVTV